MTAIPSNFKRVDSKIKRRLIMSIEGDWGTGKTDLALTAPGPIAFFKFDLNSDVTLAKWSDKKEIYRVDYQIPDPYAKDGQAQAEQLMRSFAEDYHAALAGGAFRSIIWDTASEVWEALRLSHFGKISNVSPQHYVQVNNAFRRMLRGAFESDLNLILIHRLKDQWESVPDNKGGKKNEKTGHKERAGFSDIGFACQVMLRTTFDKDNLFQATVLKCTQNPKITWRTYSEIGGMRTNSFPFVALDVFPGTKLDDWE